jgi:hypothetical protein
LRESRVCANRWGCSFFSSKSKSESDVSAQSKFLLTLHDVAAGRALSVAERTPHDYGITAGMSVLLGLIENMASETAESNAVAD